MNYSPNTVAGLKTATFQMRINPEIKHRVEAVYAKRGLTLTDAVNIFILQSLNDDRLPFLASPENTEYMRAKAMRRLTDEVQKGWESAEIGGWLTLDEAETRLGAGIE